MGSVGEEGYCGLLEEIESFLVTAVTDKDSR